MRKQYSFRPGDTGLDAWDVDRLIELSASFAVRQIPIGSIWEVDEVYWFADGEQRPTVRTIIEHIRLTNEVDSSYPIILGADRRVMDGMHRVVKAILDGQGTIAAVQFEIDPEPDYRNCMPSDLPYDE
jgi:hypothetical protein